jgi:hypothetical protein
MVKISYNAKRNCRNYIHFQINHYLIIDLYNCNWFHGYNVIFAANLKIIRMEVERIENYDYKHFPGKAFLFGFIFSAIKKYIIFQDFNAINLITLNK